MALHRLCRAVRCRQWRDDDRPRHGSRGTLRPRPLRRGQWRAGRAGADREGVRARWPPPLPGRCCRTTTPSRSCWRPWRSVRWSSSDGQCGVDARSKRSRRHGRKCAARPDGPAAEPTGPSRGRSDQAAVVARRTSLDRHWRRPAASCGTPSTRRPHRPASTPGGSPGGRAPRPRPRRCAGARPVLLEAGGDQVVEPLGHFEPASRTRGATACSTWLLISRLSSPSKIGLPVSRK